MKTLFTIILLLGALLLPASRSFREAVVHGVTVVASSAERFVLRGDYSEIRLVDGDEFQDVVREPGRVVVVVFQKKLMASSRSKTAELDKMLKELPSKVLIAKVLTDRNADLVEQLKIKDVPTISVYREGVLLQQFSGDIDVARLKSYIEARTAEKMTIDDGGVEIRPMSDDWLPPGVQKK